MPDKIFVDTNIWIYEIIPSKNKIDNDKKNRIDEILRKNPDIVISNQILNELSNVLLRKFEKNILEIKEDLKRILSFTELYLIDELDTLKALDLFKKYKTSFYDSLVLVSAIDSDCKIIYSEDFQHKQIIEKKLKIINPFKKE